MYFYDWLKKSMEDSTGDQAIGEINDLLKTHLCLLIVNVLIRSLGRWGKRGWFSNRLLAWCPAKLAYHSDPSCARKETEEPFQEWIALSIFLRGALFSAVISHLPCNWEEVEIQRVLTVTITAFVRAAALNPFNKKKDPKGTCKKLDAKFSYRARGKWSVRHRKGIGKIPQRTKH